MANSYDESLPTDKDWARFKLGDTDSSEWLLADETITAEITRLGKYAGIASLARGLIARFGRESNRLERDGDVKIEWKDRLAGWRQVAEEMDRLAKANPRVTVERGRRVGRLDEPDTSIFRP